MLGAAHGGDGTTFGCDLSRAADTAVGLSSAVYRGGRIEGHRRLRENRC